MNLATLGATLGGLWDQYGDVLPQPAKDAFVTLVKGADAIDAGIEEFFAAFNEAAGIEDEPVDEDDTGYHCRSCMLNDAPIESLTMTEMLEYVRDYSLVDYVATTAEKILDQAESRGTEVDEFIPSMRSTVEALFMQAREAQNPTVWGPVE